MGALLVLGVIAAFVAASWLGAWVGRSWSSLPSATPGGVVKFRGYAVGVEQHFVIQEIHHQRNQGTTIVLQAPSKVKV